MAATTKPQQILELNPASEIVFVGPFDRVVTSYLKLSNPSEHKVCFKVKTTAPRRYCVRPNSGILPSKGGQKIAIMLQPTDFDSQSERSKHKFMVQSTLIKNEDTNLEDIWKEADPDSIMDSKLRCVFQPMMGHPQEDVSIRPALEKSKQTSVAPSSPSQADNVQQKSDQPNTSSGHLFDDRTKFFKAEQPVMSTPAQRAAPSVRAFAPGQNLNKSVASSQNLTSSFLQPMSDDHKILLVSLLMLIIGVILGKYII